MLIKNVGVKLKRLRLDLITSTDRIKIVLYKSVNKSKIFWQILNFVKKGVFWLEKSYF
jgi:hypothetical protein